MLRLPVTGFTPSVTLPVTPFLTSFSVISVAKPPAENRFDSSIEATFFKQVKP